MEITASLSSAVDFLNSIVSDSLCVIELLYLTPALYLHSQTPNYELLTLNSFTVIDLAGLNIFSPGI
jgi:hypothetical protein